MLEGYCPLLDAPQVRSMRQRYAARDRITPTERRVRQLVDGEMSAGAHLVTWDGADEAGRPQPSGVYVAWLEAAGLLATRKLTLVK